MAHSILIIDDDQQVRDLLSQYLGTVLGYQVTSVGDGQLGIEAALEKKFDLAIIDVHLPGQSGPDIYTRLKNMCPNIEAIFFTGDQEFDECLDFLRFALPPERVVKKPLQSNAVLTKLIISILGPPVA